MRYTIHNAVLTAEIDTHGAELCSLRSNLTGIEYIWQADPEVWARHAPLLFPIIGRLKDKQYTVKGETYDITQHGFARDSEFECIEQNEDSLAMSLVISEE
ncbi:MAG: aldose 1-epimerase family protein, partial [Butyricicoccaceae bacterium]